MGVVLMCPGRRLLRRLLVPLAAGMLTAACGTVAPGSATPPRPPGDAERGRQVIHDVGCGSCHVVPGVSGASGRVGPKLEDLAEQQVIAGRLPTTPSNLARWVRDPQRIDPGVDMPDLHLTRSQARDVAAYLLTTGR